MKSRLAALVLVAVLAAGATAPSPSPEEELLALTRALLENIYLHPSADFYAAHVAPEVTAYEGPPTRRDGIHYHLFALGQLAQARPAGEVRHLELLNPKVQLYGDAAIVTATSGVTVLRDGEFTTNYLNETRVWVRRGGAWKLVHLHKSPVRWPPQD